jgi:hypothetical protein
MKKRDILLLITVIMNLWSMSTFGSMVFSDDFSTDTTANYTWFEEGVGGDDIPLNNYSYDAVNEWVTITTANNNNILMNISIDASQTTSLQSGYFEFSFMPYQTYHIDGLVRMRLYGISDPSDMYMWHFAHNSGLADAGVDQGYRAHLEKWVDGNPIIQEIFIPYPDHYDLGQWHTMAMSFSPTTLSGYLDGQLIGSFSDISSTPINVGSLELVFQQQDQHVDNIFLTPIPSAVVLGSLGLTFSGWILKRRKMV